jgi:hypothetical protein
MEKGISGAFGVIDTWIRALFSAVELTVFLPFQFIIALFN